MKSKCFQVLLFSTLILSLFFACSKEQNDFAPAPKSDVLSMSISAAPRVSPASYKWIKRKADRFEQVLAILQLDVEALLEQTADCNARQSLAQQFDVQISELTMATEIADLLRLDITITEAMFIHNTFEQLLYHSTSKREFDFQNFDRAANQIIDIGILSQIHSNQLIGYIEDYIENHCEDCIDIDRPTFLEINQWIAKAKSLKPVVSYTCQCPANHCIASTTNENDLGSFNFPSNTNAPITTVSPASTKWIKKKAFRFKTLALNLGLRDATDLLNLAGQYEKRLQLAQSYHVDYSELTRIVELTDLMRTGMTLIDAALFQGTISSLIERNQFSTRFPNLHQSIPNQEAVLNAVLFSQIQPSELLYEVDLFVNSICGDCEDISVPPPGAVNNWTEKAQDLAPKITYHY